MLRAIDIQHILVQSNSMERVQQTQQQNPELRQRYLDVQAKEEKKLSKETVKNTEESKRARVQEKEEHEESKRNAAEQHKERDPQDHEDEYNDEGHGDIIDIIV